MSELHSDGKSEVSNNENQEIKSAESVKNTEATGGKASLETKTDTINDAEETGGFHDDITGETEDADNEVLEEESENSLDTEESGDDELEDAETDDADKVGFDDEETDTGMEDEDDIAEDKAEKEKKALEQISPDAEYIPASDIDMQYARGIGDTFWSERGGKENYTDSAKCIPRIQEELASGKSIDEIKQDPELGTAASMYFDPKNMVQVRLTEDGTYEYLDDGRHRILAAKEVGVDIPVRVVERPDDNT